MIQLQQGLVQQATCEGSIQASHGLVSLLLSISVFALLYGVPDNYFFVVFTLFKVLQT